MGNTVKSFKKMKNKSFRKTAFVEIEEGFSLPLKSLSVTEHRKVFDYGIEKVYTSRNFNVEEMEEYKKENPNTNMAVMKVFKVVELDKTDYDDKMANEINSTLKPLVETVRYIDLDFINEDGVVLWEDLELDAKDDYVGLAKKLFYKKEDGGFELGEVFLTKLALTIRTLEDDPILMKIAQLEKMYEKKSSFEMLDDLLKVESLSDEVEDLKTKLDELLNSGKE